MRFECVSRTDVGLRRKINEDSVFADSERGLWAVADGMGGHEAGEVASNMVTDALRCLGRYRRALAEVVFGVDAVVTRPGRVRVGDEVEGR